MSTLPTKIVSTVIIFFLSTQTASSQAKEETAFDIALPDVYKTLNTDTAKMRFLEATISDSLNEGRLNKVLSWSHIGLSMAQKNKVDSMQGIFYFDIAKAFTYKFNQFDSAIAYYKKASPFFTDEKSNYYISTIRELMERYADKGNRDSSLAYAEKIKKMLIGMPSTSRAKARLYQSLALNYQSFGMTKTAIQFYQQAMQVAEATKNNRSLGMSLANLGELYNQSGDNIKAIDYSKQALQYLKDVPMPYMQTAGNIAEYYSNLKQLDSAKHYLSHSDSVVKEINDEETALVNRNIEASILIAEKKYAAAKIILDSCLAVLSKNDNNWNKCRLLSTYAVLDSATGFYANAILHLNTMMTIAEHEKFPSFTLQAYQMLTPLYRTTGQYKEASDIQLQYNTLKDSLSDVKIKAELADLEVSYQTRQKEDRIKLLTSENALKLLELGNSRRNMLLYILGSIFLIATISLLYYQHIQKNKLNTEKLKAELETQVLRLQMNPHFIFNSLNSIENFIMQNEKRLASDYLNKFARLIRLILDSSSDELVPVLKDFEALQLYIDLEQLRFNHKFSCSIDIDPALANGDYMIPAMLVQPYVENAIVHGLSHSEASDLTLRIRANLLENEIKFSISDNGIGREKAAAYNALNKPNHKSVGLSINENRILHFNGKSGRPNPVKITDLYDDKQQPCGTNIEIYLSIV